MRVSDASTVERDAVWQNGGFETGPATTPPSGWVANPNLNSAGITGYGPGAIPPNVAALKLASGGVLMSRSLGPNTTLSQADADLGTKPGFRYPRFDNYSAVVNYGGLTANGNTKNANLMQQSMQVGLGDIDPSDNKIHLRFAYAPVLEFPSHSFSQQPYFMVQLVNQSRGNAVLYTQFSIVGQSGVPWQPAVGTITNSTVLWSDWTLADISPSADQLSVNDTVTLSVVAAGCAVNRHFGRVYVDGFGTQVPGAFVSASGLSQVAVNSNATYSIHYANGAATTMNGALINIVTPQNTNFVSLSGLSSCTTPAVGAPGPQTIVCPVGTLSPSSYGDFSLTLQVAPGAAGNLAFANYSISAQNYPALLGRQVLSAVTSGPVADVAVQYSNPITVANWGQTLNFNVTVLNQSPNNLSAGTVNVVYPQDANFSSMSWTCQPAAACVSASGTGSLSEYPLLAANGNVTYSITATTANGSGVGSANGIFAANVISNAVDPFPLNNNQIINFGIGAPQNLTVQNLTGFGTVSTSPVGASISNASSATVSFVTGSQVQLSANPSLGASFVSWGGACSGSSPTCIVTMSAARSVTASFAPPPAAGTATQLLALLGNNQYAATGSQFATNLWVEALDANGTPAANTNVTISGGNATYSPATAQTNANGIAIFTATANATVGSYTANANATGGLTASFKLTNSGAVATVVPLEGDAQTADTGAQFAIPLVAQVQDASGNPIPNVNVTFNANSTTGGSTWANGTVSAVSDASGYVTIFPVANATANTTGYRVTATAGSSSGTFGLINAAQTATYLNITGGNNQTVPVSSKFGAPLSVNVIDTTGSAVQGAVVTFTAVPAAGASGTITPITATTDAFGNASATNVTANTTFGTWTVKASTGTAATAAVTFTLNNDGSQYLNITSGTPQNATVGTQFSDRLAVKLTDQSGNPVANANVKFTASTGNANATLNANATAVVTDSSGVAYAIATAGSYTGTYTVTATTPNATRPVTFTLSNVAGNANKVTVNAGGTQNTVVNTAFATALQVKVTDVFGNLVPNAAVTFSAPTTGASATLSPNPVATDANGLASTTATANTTASATVYAVNANTGTASGAAFALTNKAAAAAGLVLSPNTTASTPIYISRSASLTVSSLLADTYGNGVATGTTTFTINPNTVVGTLGTLPGTATFTFTNAATATGVAVNANATRSGPFTVTVTSAGFTAVEYFAAYGNPNSVLISPSAPSTTVNTALTGGVTFTVVDNANVPVPNASVTFTAPNTSGLPGGTLSPTGPQTTNSVGQIVITPTANTTSGNYNVVLSTNASNFTFVFTNTAAAATTFNIIGNQNQSAAVNTSFAGLGLKLADQYGNGVPGATVTVTVPGAQPSAAISPLTYTTNANGKVAATNEIVAAVAGTKTGSYQVSAATGSFTALQWALNNTPGSPNKIIPGPTTQNGNVGTPFNPNISLQVQDQYGNPIPGTAVSMTCTPSAGGACATLTPASGAADSGGNFVVVANANNTAGTYVITATAGTATATYTFTNIAGNANKLTAAAVSNNQNTVVNTAFGKTLQVNVSDVYGNPVQGANVTFTAPSTGASVSFTGSNIVTSDSTGLAQITATANLVANSTANPNTYVVTATATGLSPANFTLTNKPASPNALVLSPSNTSVTAPLVGTISSNFTTPLSVQVVDKYGNAIPGANVSYAINSNATTNAGATLLSPLSGTAGTVATSGAPPAASANLAANSSFGVYTVTVSSAGTAAQTFTLQNINTPAKIVVVSGGEQSGVVGQSFSANFVVAVQDASNNGVPGAAVTFTVPATDPNASLSQYTFVTATSGSIGQVSVPVTAGHIVGAYKITAQSSGFSVDANMTNTVGAASRLVAATNATPQNGNVNTAYATPLGLQVTDPYGNPVPNAHVTFTVQPASNGAGASFASSTFTSDSSGNVSVTANANTTAGTFTVTATTSDGGSPVSLVYTLTNVGGVPAQIAVNSGNNQSTTVGAVFNQNLVVFVSDQYNNPVLGAAITFTPPSSGAGSGATFAPASPTTDINGLAYVQVTAGTVSGNYNIVATAPGVSTGATFNLTNTAGAPTSVATQSGTPQSTQVGTTFTQALVAQVFDQYQNLVPGAPVFFVAPLSPPSATLSSTRVVTDANGQATVNAAALTTAGSFTVAASVENVSTAASFALAATAGPVVALVADPQNQGVTVVTSGSGTPVSLGFTAVDAYGNPVSGTHIDVTAPQNGATAAISPSGPYTTDQNGHLTVQATPNDRVGDYAIVANVDGSTTPSLAFPMSNAATDAPTLALTPATQSATVGQAFATAIQVTVTSSDPNAIANRVVHFSVPTTGATAQLSASTAVTDSSGVATVNATAGGTAGSYAVVAIVSGTASSAFVELTNTAGAAATIVANGGTTPQQAMSSHQYGVPLSVTVLDANNNPVSGATVTWTVPSTSPTVTLQGATAGTSTTDAFGHAAVTAIADNGQGAVQVTASVSGVTTPATFNLNNTPAPGLTLSLVSGAAGSARVDQTFTSAPVFVVRDSTGAPVVGAQVTAVAVSVSGTASATFDAFDTTDATGSAVMNATANTVAGTYQVVVSVPNGIAPVVFTLTNLPGDAAHILLASNANPNQSAQVHHFFATPLLVEVTDAFDNPVVGQVITYTVPSSEPLATLVPLAASSDGSGIARVYAIAGGQAGGYFADASYGVSAGSVSFGLNNTAAGGVNSIAVLSGGGQSAHAAGRFAQPLVVVVYDSADYAASGVPVTFSGDPNAFVFASASTITDGSGQASTVVTSEHKAGTYPITATEGGSGASTSTSFTVSLIPTTTTLNTNDHTTLGIPLELDATVTAPAGDGTPTGVVEFYADTTKLGTVTLDANGKASLSGTPPAVGNHDMSAHYIPTGSYEASKSDQQVLVVDYGWRAIGNNCAEGSSNVWAFAAIAGALLAWRAHRQRHSKEHSMKR